VQFPNEDGMDGRVRSESAGPEWPAGTRAPMPGDARLPGARPAEMTPAEFGRLRALIGPHPGESRWADVPWQTSLWEARRKRPPRASRSISWPRTCHSTSASRRSHGSRHARASQQKPAARSPRPGR